MNTEPLGHAELGHIKGNVYENYLFGFVYSFASDWKLIDPGTMLSVSTSVPLLLATQETAPNLTALTISCIRLENEKITARDYLIGQRSASQGSLTPQGKVSEYIWGGQRFTRQIYFGTLGGKPVWQVDSLIIAHGCVLQFRLITTVKKSFEEFVTGGHNLRFRQERLPKPPVPSKQTSPRKHKLSLA